MSLCRCGTVKSSEPAVGIFLKGVSGKAATLAQAWATLQSKMPCCIGAITQRQGTFVEISSNGISQGAHQHDDLYCATAAQGLQPPYAARQSAPQVQHWSFGKLQHFPLLQAALRRAVLVGARFDVVWHPAGPARIACLQARRAHVRMSRPNGECAATDERKQAGRSRRQAMTHL